MDFRVGGTWFYCMRGQDQDGKPMDSCGKSTYEAIEAPEKIVHTDAFVDKEGNLPANIPTMHMTVTFVAVDGKTQVTSVTVFATPEDLDAVAGDRDKLIQQVEKSHAISLEEAETEVDAWAKRMTEIQAT